MDAENSFDLQIQLDFTDVVHANRLYRASTSDYVANLAIGLLCTCLGGQYVLSQPLDLGDSFGWLLNLIFILGLLLLFDLISPFVIWLSYRKNHQHFTESHKAIFRANDITIQGRNVNAQYKWAYFNSAAEGKCEFILIYGNGLYFSVPKKVFNDVNEVEGFRNLLKSKIPVFKQRLKILMDFQK